MFSVPPAEGKVTTVSTELLAALGVCATRPRAPQSVTAPSNSANCNALGLILHLANSRSIRRRRGRSSRHRVCQGVSDLPIRESPPGTRVLAAALPRRYGPLRMRVLAEKMEGQRPPAHTTRSALERAAVSDSRETSVEALPDPRRLTDPRLTSHIRQTDGESTSRAPLAACPAR